MIAICVNHWWSVSGLETVTPWRDMETVARLPVEQRGEHALLEPEVLALAVVLERRVAMHGDNLRAGKSGVIGAGLQRSIVESSLEGSHERVSVVRAAAMHLHRTIDLSSRDRNREARVIEVPPQHDDDS